MASDERSRFVNWQWRSEIEELTSKPHRGFSKLTEGMRDGIKKAATRFENGLSKANSRHSPGTTHKLMDGLNDKKPRQS